MDNSTPKYDTDKWLYLDSNNKVIEGAKLTLEQKFAVMDHTKNTFLENLHRAQENIFATGPQVVELISNSRDIPFNLKQIILDVMSYEVASYMTNYLEDQLLQQHIENDKS